MEKFEGNIQNFVHYFPKREVIGNLDYITDSSLPIQFGIHEPKEDRVSKIHFHKFGTEFFYVERGEIFINFTDNKFNPIGSKYIKQGDSFVMYPGIGHEVHLPKGCRVIEVHTGPYVDDKVFRDATTNL